MAESDQVATSVFIHQPSSGRVTRIASTRPLLTSQSTSNSSSTSKSKGEGCGMSNRIMLITTLVFAVATALFISLLLVFSGGGTERVSLYNLCPENYASHYIKTSGASNSSMTCPKTKVSTEGCVGGDDERWRLFTTQHHNFADVIALLPINQSATNVTVVVSPLFAIPADTCSATVSYSDVTSGDAFLVSTGNGSVSSPLTSTSNNASRCEFVSWGNPAFFAGAESIRVAMTTASASDRATTIRAAVDFHACARFSPIGDDASTTARRPDFAADNRARTCSLEYADGGRRVDCDWWNMNSASGGEGAKFERVPTTDCVGRGAPQPADAVWFLQLTGGERATLVSPLFRRDTAHLVLSLWYNMKCEGSSLRVYIVPQFFDFRAVAEWWTPVVDVYDESTAHWTFASFQISVPWQFSAFHVNF